MRNLNGLGLAVALLAVGAAGASAPAATTGVPVTVTFSPVLDQRFDADYGAPERDTLRAIVVDAVDRALDRRARRAALAADARVDVVVGDAQPSHPTRSQLLQNPSIDPLRSRSLGGADLKGTVLAADGRVLATVAYDYYAPDFGTASPGGDAWADARIAIDRFAGQLAARLPPAR